MGELKLDTKEYRNFADATLLLLEAGASASQLKEEINYQLKVKNKARE